MSPYFAIYGTCFLDEHRRRRNCFDLSAAVLWTEHTTIWSETLPEGDQSQTKEGSGPDGERATRWLRHDTKHSATIGCFFLFFFNTFCVLSECGSRLLSAEEALKLLKRTQCHPGLNLAETQPLCGELEDATARAYAAIGESWSVQVFALVKCFLPQFFNHPILIGFCFRDVFLQIFLFWFT